MTALPSRSTVAALAGQLLARRAGAPAPPAPLQPAPTPATPTVQRARLAHLEALTPAESRQAALDLRVEELTEHGLPDWHARLLAEDEARACTLHRVGIVMALPWGCREWGAHHEGPARLREAPKGYGPVASLPSAPTRWRWADLLPVRESRGEQTIHHPCDRKETDR